MEHGGIRKILWIVGVAIVLIIAAALFVRLWQRIQYVQNYTHSTGSTRQARWQMRAVDELNSIFRNRDADNITKIVVIDWHASKGKAFVKGKDDQTIRDFVREFDPKRLRVVGEPAKGRKSIGYQLAVYRVNAPRIRFYLPSLDRKEGQDEVLAPNVRAKGLGALMSKAIAEAESMKYAK